MDPQVSLWKDSGESQRKRGLQEGGQGYTGGGDGAEGGEEEGPGGLVCTPGGCHLLETKKMGKGDRGSEVTLTPFSGLPLLIYK